MYNDTSLTPNSFKSSINDYVESFLFVLKNKWLYLVPLFFSLVRSIYSIGLQIHYRFTQPDIFKQQFIFENIFRTTPQSFSEKIITAITSIQLSSVVSSLSLISIFGAVGAIVAYLIFYKYFKKIFSKSRFIEKCGRYSLYVIAVSTLIGFASFFFFKNLVVTSISTLTALISLQILLIILITVLQGAFIFYIKSLWFKEKISFEILFSQAEEIFKPLFFFNLIILFVSPTFFVSVMPLPDSIPQNLYIGISLFIKYFHALFIVIFIFVPFLLAIRMAESLSDAFRKNLLLIRKNFLSYLSLVAIGSLALVALALIFELLIPSPLFLSLIAIVKETTYNIVLSFLVVIFSVAVFKRVALFNQ